MKPSEIINQGEGFVTVCQRAHSAVEIARVLNRQGIRRVYKGDQNQLWDAVVTNQCLASATSGSLLDGLVLFIQDEKLGTPDARLRYFWRLRGRRFALTEDYYGRHRGAVWEHQDGTYGLFYTEPVEPRSFARVGVNLARAAELWARHGAAAMADEGFRAALRLLGVSLEWDRSDEATRLGPPVETELYATLFRVRPEAGLFYALTRSTGLYGIVPTVNDDVTTSSIRADQPELRELGRWLLVQVAARGAMRTAGDRAARRAVKERARRLARWSQEFLTANPNASVADFQAGVAGFLWRETRSAATGTGAMPLLQRTSKLLAISPADAGRLEQPEEVLYFFLDLALRHPKAFAEAYNESLLRVGFGLQRVKYDGATGRYTPPFFVEFAPGGEGTPVYRFSLELSGRQATRVTLANRQVGKFVLESPWPVRTAACLFRVLFDQLPTGGSVAVVGKAAPFAAELKRWPGTMAMPRQGSKYAPMIDHLLAGLKARGVLDETCGLVLRIGVNSLDALASMGERVLRLPRFLQSAFGKQATCRELAVRWREVAATAERRLRLLEQVEVGQHVHVARVLACNARGHDLFAEAERDSRLRRFLEFVAGEPAAWEPWRAIGADVPSAVGETLATLLVRREELLARRRALRSECPPEIEAARAVIDCQLLLIYAAYVRRLCQQAESLPYLNDRPYSLALWLLFGPEIFVTIVDRAEFDVEFICERVAETSPCGSR